MKFPNHNFVFFGTSRLSNYVLEELASANLVPVQVIGKHSTLEDFRVEFGVLASYGKIIPKETLALFPKGILNMHPSLLPRYRGPTPFQSGILNGDEEFGVSIMLLDEKMDHGPVLGSAKCKMQSAKFLELEERLGRLGGKLLAEIIPKWLAGEITPIEQNHAHATYTKIYTAADAELDLSKPEEAMRKVRAFNPEPGAWIMDNGLRIRVLDGEILGGVFSPTQVTPAGRSLMGWADYLRGRRP